MSPRTQHSRGLVSTKGPGIRSGRAGGTACGDAFIFQAGARLVSAYLLDGCLGKQAAQPGGHRAVGELPEAGSVVTDHHGGCARARETSASAGSESGRGYSPKHQLKGPATAIWNGRRSPLARPASRPGMPERSVAAASSLSVHHCILSFATVYIAATLRISRNS